MAAHEVAERGTSAEKAALASGEPLLKVAGLSAGYGRKRVIFDVDLQVGTGEVVTLLGHNGAGKTTTIKTVFGMVKSQTGTVTYDGRDVGGTSCRRNVLNGMSLIAAERFVFADLTVADNLRLGGLSEKSSRARAANQERVDAMFPILTERSGQLAGTMSGGQQRMLSIGVALMSSPRLLLLDEPSLGLAPGLVKEMFGLIRRLAVEENLSVLLIEQNVTQALAISDRAYVMRSGRIILDQAAAKLRERTDYWDLF